MKERTNEHIYQLQRAGASEQIFDILKKQIAAGEWKVGEKIPSENEIAAQFNVSRMTARNALQRLNALGLLESRVGEGTFVKQFHLSSYIGSVSDLLNSGTSMGDVREFRSFFEAICLELACARQTDTDISALEIILKEMRGHADTGDEVAFHEADMKFHRYIAKMTGNDMILMVQYILQDLLRAQTEANTSLYGVVKNASYRKEDDNYYLKLLADDHCKYIEALKKRDYHIAIDDLNRYLEQYKEMDEKNPQ